jgi:hypothetical protein
VQLEPDHHKIIVEMVNLVPRLVLELDHELRELTDETDCSDNLLQACIRILRGEHAGRCARVLRFTADMEVLADVPGSGQVFIPSLGVQHSFIFVAGLVVSWLCAYCK